MEPCGQNRSVLAAGEEENGRDDLEGDQRYEGDLAEKDEKDERVGPTVAHELVQRDEEVRQVAGEVLHARLELGGGRSRGEEAFRTRFAVAKA